MSFALWTYSGYVFSILLFELGQLPFSSTRQGHLAYFDHLGVNRLLFVVFHFLVAIIRSSSHSSQSHDERQLFLYESRRSPSFLK